MTLPFAVRSVRQRAARAQTAESGGGNLAGVVGGDVTWPIDPVRLLNSRETAQRESAAGLRQDP